MSAFRSKRTFGFHLHFTLNSLLPFFLSSHVQDAYRRDLETPRYTDAQWDMLCVLWNIYDRVCRLEALLEGLEKHGQKVDFTQTPEAHEVMKQLIDQLHTQEVSVLPHAE